MFKTGTTTFGTTIPLSATAVFPGPASPTCKQFLSVTPPSFYAEDIHHTEMIPPHIKDGIGSSKFFAGKEDQTFGDIISIAVEAQNATDPATAGSLYKHLAERLEAKLPDRTPLYLQLEKWEMGGFQSYVSALLSAAHAFAKSNQPHEAGPLFRKGLDTLMSPATNDSTAALIFQTLPNGSEFVIGAFTGAATFAKELDESTLQALTQKIELFQSRHSPDYKVAPLLEGILLSCTIGRQTTPQREVVDKAIEKLNDAYENGLESTDINTLEIAWRSKLLTMELLTHRLVLTHESRRFDLRKKTRLQIYTTVTELSNVLTLLQEANPSPDWLQERINHTASQIADVARVLMKRKLSKPSLRVARMLLDDTLYATSPSLIDLRSDPLFAKYANLGTLHNPGSSTHTHMADRIKAALVHQHSNGLAETAVTAAAGALAVGGAEYLATGDFSAVAALAGVFATTAISRIYNGFKSEESRSAGAVGNSDISGAQSAQAAGKLFFDAGKVTLASLIPIAAASLGAVGADTVAKIGQRTYATYFGGATQWGEGFSNLINSYFHSDSSLAMNLMRIYGAGSAAVFSAYIIAPLLRLFGNKGMKTADVLMQKVDKLAPWCFPGAVFMFADVGSLISQKDDLWFRILRGTVCSIEMFATMMAAGIAKAVIQKRSQDPNAVSSQATPVWKNVLTFLKEQKYTYATAGLYAQMFNTLVGGKIQGDATFKTDSWQNFINSLSPETASTAILQGWLISYGLLPLALLTSGLPKKNISPLRHAMEGWQDAKKAKANPLRMAYEGVAGIFRAFSESSYARNRSFRITNIDTLPAFVRALFGWDTTAGQMAFSFMMMAWGGPSANAVWPEPAGTGWERETIEKHTRALLKADEEKRQTLLAAGQEPGAQLTYKQALEQSQAAFDNFFEKSGQNMSLWQFFMPHRKVSGRMSFFTAIKRAVKKPNYPQRPSTRTFANAYQMFMDEHSDFHLDPKVLEQVFDAIKRHAVNPNTYHVSRWWAMTLAMARDSKVHGKRIEQFFAENPHLATWLDLDLDTLNTSGSPYRRIRRRQVMKTIEEAMSFKRLQEAVAVHGASSIKDAVGPSFNGPEYDNHSVHRHQSEPPTEGEDEDTTGEVTVETHPVDNTTQPLATVYRFPFHY